MREDAGKIPFEHYFKTISIPKADEWFANTMARHFGVTVEISLDVDESYSLCTVRGPYDKVQEWLKVMYKGKA